MHVALRLDHAEVVDQLLLADATEGDDGEDLRLPAGEEGGAVGAREQAHRTGDGAHFVDRTPVRPAALVEDEAAQFLIGLLLECHGGSRRASPGTAGRSLRCSLATSSAVCFSRAFLSWFWMDSRSSSEYLAMAAFTSSLTPIGT